MQYSVQKKTCSQQVLVVTCLLSLFVHASADAQSTVSWTVANTSSLFDANPELVSPLYAVNGGGLDVTTGGIVFENGSFASTALPAGVTFSPTGASSGNTAKGTLFNTIATIPTTGDTGYDTLINSFAWTDGTPSGITTGDFAFSGLTPGVDYQFQFWYGDHRDSTGFSNRVLEIDDGFGNSASLWSGAGEYGQYATGEFVAAATSQTFSLEATNFGNLHFNAFLLRENRPVIQSSPPAVKNTPGWTIETHEQWIAATSAASQFAVNNGEATPIANGSLYESHIQQFAEKQRFRSIDFKQTANWGSAKWESAGDLGPTSEPDAPVFVSPAEGEYYYFNRGGSGSDYHAWFSSDMESWTDLGNVTQSDWVTSAEYKDGVIYVYYDEPNDQTPYLVTLEFDDPVNRVPGQWTRQTYGQVLDTQSHGSDMAAYRDLDDTFHIIYEDWQAINARQHSWDAQYAGHASSADGINGFEPHEHTPPIDERGSPVLDEFGNPTFGTYTHPNGTLTYQIYDNNGEPIHAWGDYEMIRVGDTYYLFADDDLEGSGIGLGYWYSDDLYSEFTYAGRIRSGLHPDPGGGLVTFGTGESAEQKFVLFVQGAANGAGQDLTSNGPWVTGVEAQAGVDTDGDGTIDVWTDWQTVEEQYARIDGFAKAYSVDPAAIDLSDLPAGYGIQFRFRTDDAAAVMDAILIDSINFLAGDYDANGVVDTADYLVWKEAFGTNSAAADGNGDGIVDVADYTVWRDALNLAAASSARAAVPEPSAGTLLLLALLVTQRRGWTRSARLASA